MDSDDFVRLARKDELVMRMLQVYYFALQTIMCPITAMEWADKPRLPTAEEIKGSTARWAEDIKDFPAHFQRYLEWPTKIQRAAKDGSLASCLFEPWVENCFFK